MQVPPTSPVVRRHQQHYVRCENSLYRRHVLLSCVCADRCRQSTRDEVPTSRREAVFPRQPQRSVQSHRRSLRHVAARSAPATAPTAETDHRRQCVYIASLPLSVIIMIIIIIIVILIGLGPSEKSWTRPDHHRHQLAL